MNIVEEALRNAKRECVFREYRKRQFDEEMTKIAAATSDAKTTAMQIDPDLSYDAAYSKARKRTSLSVLRELVRVCRKEDPSANEWQHAIIAADKIINEQMML